MPWMETCAMDERMRFIVETQRGERTMADLCRVYGISRKTGYKWVNRYAAMGPAGLVEQSRAPHTHPQAVSPAVADRILATRAAHPTWGPRKLVAHLARTQPAVALPAASTVGDLVKRAGLTVPRRPRRRCPPSSQPLAHADRPNTVWCADFKGQFPVGDGTWCYPLTISDAHSRYLLRCQALPRIDGMHVRPLFEATFREYGLPAAIRTDNGPPFASTGLGGLTALSVWWLKLGIRPERIAPGKPAQNGRHERMHRTLKAETVLPPAATLRAQQRAFDRFRQTYNQERPHEALGQRPPATVYQPSPRPYPTRLRVWAYPDADAVRRVRPNGGLRWHSQEIYVSAALAGEPVGLVSVGDGQWQLWAGPLLLACLDERHGKLIPVGSPPRGRTHRDAAAAAR